MTADTAMRSPFIVIDDFLAPGMAREMRAEIDAHFARPYQHSSKTHMVWNYWYVPGMYTYLRTLPERVIGARLAQAFHATLFAWSHETLGLAGVNSSYLSLYIDGCRQNQHNDSRNGRFGFVYSLTKDSRKTTGGETLIWREQDYFTTRLHRASYGQDFYHAIEPRFNRLLVFDDRLPHAVQLVEGNMDPLEGRIVFHGHLVEAGPRVTGSLANEVVTDIANDLAGRCSDDLGDALTSYHGVAIFRFTVAPDGSVGKLRLLVDRVKRLSGEAPDVLTMLGRLTARLLQQRFPHANAETVVTLPFSFGNSL